MKFTDWLREQDESNPKKLVKKDCGIHWGHEPGPCPKCAYFDKLKYDPKFKKFRKGLQYDGTPWNAVIGQNESMNDIQRLNIDSTLARDLESLKWVQELDNEQKQYVLEIFRRFLGA